MPRFVSFRSMLAAASVLLTPALALAQQQQTTVFAVTAHGGIVYVGGELGGDGGGGGARPATGTGGQAFIQAFDQSGNFLWSKVFGDASQEDRVLGIAADDSGVYAAGYTYGSIGGQTPIGGEDAFLVKYDTTGNARWASQFGTTADEFASAVTVDSTGVYVTGATLGVLPGQISSGQQDVYARKYTSAGSVVWTLQYGTTGIDRGYGIALDSSGVYVVGRSTGVFAGQVSAGMMDGFVSKLDRSGNFQWVAQYGSFGDDRGWAIATDNSGVYMTGRVEGSLRGMYFQGDDDTYVMKYDQNGNLLWLSEFGTPFFDRGTAMATDATGVYTGGMTDGAFSGNVNYGSRDAYIEKFDSAGNVLWIRQFGSVGYDVAWGVTTDDTGVYLAGQAGGPLPESTASKGGFLAKYDTAGNLIWVNEFTPAN